MQLHSTDQRDVLQDRIVRLASELSFETLPADVSEAALGRVIDTFAAAFAGSQSGAAQSARAYAAAFPITNGATVF